MPTGSFFWFFFVLVLFKEDNEDKNKDIHIDGGKAMKNAWEMFIEAHKEELLGNLSLYGEMEGMDLLKFSGRGGLVNYIEVKASETEEAMQAVKKEIAKAKNLQQAAIKAVKHLLPDEQVTFCNHKLAAGEYSTTFKAGIFPYSRHYHCIGKAGLALGRTLFRTSEVIYLQWEEKLAVDIADAFIKGKDHHRRQSLKRLLS